MIRKFNKGLNELTTVRLSDDGEAISDIPEISSSEASNLKTADASVEVTLIAAKVWTDGVV